MLSKTNDNLTLFLAEIAETNYYNNSQNLIRVKVGSKTEQKYFDFPLMVNYEYPNPTIHYALVLTNESILNELKGAIVPGDPRMDNIPGYVRADKLSSSIARGFCWLVSRQVKSNTTNYNVGQAGNFNNTANITSDAQNVRFSLSPGLNKSYTTTEEQYVGDKKFDNIGIFMTDNSILLKSAGGSILLGPDGVSILGPKTETATIETNGVMQKNPLGTIIPETMMTFPVAIKNIPNIDMIMSIGNSVNRISQIAIAMGSATTAVSSLR